MLLALLQILYVNQAINWGRLGSTRTLPDCRPADSDPELEGPALLDGEEEPDDDPEEEMQDGGDHAREHRAIQGSLVDYILIQ